MIGLIEERLVEMTGPVENMITIGAEEEWKGIGISDVEEETITKTTSEYSLSLAAMEEGETSAIEIWATEDPETIEE